MKKWALLFLLVFLGLAYFWITAAQQEAPSHKRQHFKDKYGSYFYPLSLSKFTRAGIPCIDIEVEGVSVSAILDLGFRGQFSFSSPFLNTLKNVRYIGTQKMFRFRGGEYEETLYEIPKVDVGAVTFFDSLLHEHSEQGEEESRILKKGAHSSDSEPCALGWVLFEITNLFLDLENSQLAFCDSITTLKSQGYPIDEFIKTPLRVDRGFLECELNIDGNTLQCILDTGASVNILNSAIEEGEKLEEIAFDPLTVRIYNPIEVGGKNLGPIAFYQLPIRFPIPVDAILGMEFFREHLVFLDFVEKQVYFYRKCEAHR